MRTNKDTFVARFARHALASTVAGTCFVPKDYVAMAAPQPISGEVAFFDNATLTGDASYSNEKGSRIISWKQAPEDWTPNMEKEFRSLALEEAKGVLSPSHAARLEELSHWRDILQSPCSADETLLQIRRDRILEKISATLEEYVEFHQATGKKRASTR
jgi:hypothetical protein